VSRRLLREAPDLRAPGNTPRSSAPGVFRAPKPGGFAIATPRSTGVLLEVAPAPTAAIALGDLIAHNLALPLDPRR